MTTEKLIIEHFGPIKKMAFDFNKINILIGDQGTGKSLVAKTLIAVRNSVFIEIFDLEFSSKLDKETARFLEHMKLVGILNYVNEKTVIKYYRDDASLEFAKGKAVVSRDDFNIGEVLPPNFNYIPAERNMVSVLADSLYALLQVDAELPRLFLRFGNKYQSARKLKENFDYSDVLRIQFRHHNNKDFIVTHDNIELNLSDASSGIQGCVALLTVVDSAIYFPTISGRRMIPFEESLNLLAVEEPELNLFPETQKKLLNYIIRNNYFDVNYENSDKNNFTERGYKNQLLFTTHSPYILTALNNLMYAYSVGEKYRQEVNEVINEDYWVSPKDVSAYMLLPTGTCEEILDKSENLIKAEKIDSVSSFLNEQFEKLLNIELIKK